MFILDPITLATSPAGQASRSIAREAAAGSSAYRLAASVGSTTATPRVIMGQLSGAVPPGSRIGFRVNQGDDAAPVIAGGFNALGAALNVETIAGRQYALPVLARSAQFLTTRGHFLLAVDRMPAGAMETAEIVIVAPGAAPQIQLEWFLDLRVLVAAFPTPALRARLRRPRETVTSITGRVWVTERTDEAVLEALRVPLNNEYRPYLSADLAQLDGFSQFSVWPAGFERVFRDSSEIIAHRRHDFVRDCVVRTWSGWRGHSDIDVHGATGEMTLSEIPWPSSARLEIPVVTNRPTLPLHVEARTSADSRPPHAAQETPATWEGGLPIDWAPDTPVGWENE